MFLLLLLLLHILWRGILLPWHMFTYSYISGLFMYFIPAMPKSLVLVYEVGLTFWTVRIFKDYL